MKYFFVTTFQIFHQLYNFRISEKLFKPNLTQLNELLIDNWNYEIQYSTSTFSKKKVCACEEQYVWCGYKLRSAETSIFLNYYNTKYCGCSYLIKIAFLQEFQWYICNSYGIKQWTSNFCISWLQLNNWVEKQRNMQYYPIRGSF